MNRELKNWILLIVLSGIWGSSFILMKKGMYTAEEEMIFTDRQVAAIRMLIAAVVLLPFAIPILRRIKSAKHFLLLGLVGFSGNFFPAYLFTYAETGISSGYTGMLNSFTPIFALMLGFVFFKSRLNRFQILGVAIGTVGIVLLSIAGSDLSDKGTIWHIMAVLLATLCYAISLNVIKHTLQAYKGIEITAISFFIILLPSLGSNLMEGSWEQFKLNDNAMEALVYISILAVIGTAFAVFLFNVLISNSSVLFSSSVTYLIPIVAVLIGLAFQERITIWQVLSMLVILLGVFVANVLPKWKNVGSIPVK